MGSKKRPEIMPQVIDTTQRRITLNVGGQKHETYLSTIRNFPDTRLYWVVENVTKTIDYHSEKIELFFDRHPAIFALVLNYYRTGKLHCPNDVCGPLFEEELAYWGIDEKDMEPCCWTTYIQHRDAENNLKSFNVADFDGDREDDEPDNPKQNDLNGDTTSNIVYTTWLKYQPKIWPILEEPRSSKAAKVFSIISVILIVLSVAASCAMTLPDLSEPVTPVHRLANRIFVVVEYVCGVWFTWELIARIIFCPNKTRFFKSCSFWIDILSVLPFYIRILQDMANGGDRQLADALLVIRLLRLFRFFRLLYGLQVILHTLKASSYELVLLLIILLIPVILFSSIIFYVEKSFDLNTKFRSIPESFWWSLITMTTVGYGDMTPSSWAGKIIGGACAIFGVLMVALPISVIGSNFNLYYAHAQARLKLPRKKIRFHFDSLTTAMSRDALRRRGIRRRNARWSGSEDGVSLCSRANSGPKSDLRSWSIASSGKSSLDQVVEDRNGPAPFSKKKISRERRISRNERSPKLGDLLEHENEVDGSHCDNLSSSVSINNHERASSTYSNRSHERDSVCLQRNDMRRIRSHSMPSNETKPQVVQPPRKFRSDSANLCGRCSLPRDHRLKNGSPGTSKSSCNLCQCEHEHSPGIRNSLSFTIVIPSLEGPSDWIEVSTENIQPSSYPRSTSFNSDGFIFNRSTHIDCSEDVFASHRHHGSFIGNDSDNDELGECLLQGEPPDGSALPLLVVGEQMNNNRTSDKKILEHETSI